MRHREGETRAPGRARRRRGGVALVVALVVVIAAPAYGDPAPVDEGDIAPFDGILLSRLELAALVADHEATLRHLGVAQDALAGCRGDLEGAQSAIIDVGTTAVEMPSYDPPWWVYVLPAMGVLVGMVAGGLIVAMN